MKKFITLALAFLIITANSKADDYWEMLRGPFGGNVQNIGVDTKNSMYAATFNGMYKSFDKGYSWFISNNGITTNDIYAVIGDKDGNMFAGTYDHGIFKSTDFGQNWALSYNAGGLLTITSFEIGNNGELFAIGPLGAYKSADAGSSWSKIEDDEIETNKFTSIISDSDGNLYASTMYYGIYFSDDNGSSWTQKNEGLEGDALNILSLAIDENDNIYAGSKGIGVYKTTDKGETWTVVNNGFDMSFGIEAYEIEINNNGDIYTRTNNGIYWSKADDAFWFLIHDDFHGNKINDIAFNNENKVFLSADRAGVYFSAGREENWVNANAGIIASSVITIEETVNGYIFASMDDAGLFRTEDNGQRWNKLCDLKVNAMAVNPDADIFATTLDNGIQYSTDGGVSWSMTEGSINGRPLDIAIKNNGDIYVGSSSDYNSTGFWKSTDNGMTWDELYDSLEYTERKNVLSLAFNADGDVFAGTEGAGLYRSSDDGENWEVVTSVSSANVTTIAIHGDKYYIGNDRGEVYMSNDDAATWTLVKETSASDYPEKDECYKVRVSENGRALAATEFGLWLSDESAENWEKIYEWKIKDLVLSSRGYIYGATNAMAVASSDNPIEKYNSLNISVDPSEISALDWGEDVEYTLTVNDKNDSPVEGASVRIINALNGAEETKTTDASGQIKYTATVPNESSKGIYSVKFIAEKDSYNNGNYGVYLVQVNHIFPALSISVTPSEKQDVFWTDSVKYDIVVKDPSNIPVENSTIVIMDKYFGYISDNEVLTSDQGTASYTAHVKNHFPEATYSFSFFAGKDKFENSDTLDREIQVHKTVSVEEIDTDLTDMENTVLIFPNPVESVVNFRFAVQELSLVVIELYDVRGNKAAVIHNELMESGSYNVSWEDIEMPSGAYIVKARIGSTVSSQIIHINR